MINVTLENFEAEVVAASHITPVLVDFWAPWCGPCKVLGPLLEKVEEDYAGRFKLVKIDSDQEQQLSKAFGIRSIPTCVLMVNGKPADGFMGAVPEGQVKSFLDKHLPSADGLSPQEEALDAQALLAAGDPQAALNKLLETLTIDPGNDDARYDYVKLLIETNALDDATAALAPALAAIPRQLRFEALGQFLNAITFVTTDPRGQWGVDQFDALIAANKRDFDARLGKARVLMVNGLNPWTNSWKSSCATKSGATPCRAKPLSPSWSFSARPSPKPAPKTPTKRPAGSRSLAKSSLKPTPKLCSLRLIGAS